MVPDTQERPGIPEESDHQGDEPVQGWAFWAVACLVALIVGFLQGGWSAIGNLCVPILSLVISPLAAAGLLLPVYPVSDDFGLWAHRKSFDRRVLSILIPAGLLGVGVLVGKRAVGWVSQASFTR
jgi:uncharacterized protein